MDSTKYMKKQESFYTAHTNTKNMVQHWSEKKIFINTIIVTARKLVP